jgi:hypothetical protein
MATGNGWGGESAGSKPLVGKALLDRARSLSNRPEEQIARACGYVGPSGRVLRKSFYRALVEAKGYQLLGTSTAGAGAGAGSSPGGGGNAGKGRQAEYRTRVHGNGNLLIGHAYTRRMGLEPGDEFHIELHPETGAIWLLPLEPGEASAIAQQLLEDSDDTDTDEAEDESDDSEEEDGEDEKEDEDENEIVDFNADSEVDDNIDSGSSAGKV